MSRLSPRSFLSQAKQSLSQSLHSKGKHPVSFVIGNVSADLDSITGALVYGYIRSSTNEARKTNKCVIPITNIPSTDLRLRPELTALLKHAELTPSDLITIDDLGKLWEALPAETTDWTIVDHNVLQSELGEHFSGRVVGVIDHHEDEEKVRDDAEPRVIEKAGSCNSLVVNCCRDAWDAFRLSSTSGIEDDASCAPTWDAQVATLALGSILIDTVNLAAEDKVTDGDRKAVDYLEAKIRASPRTGSGYDRDTFFEEINAAKSTLDELSLDDVLRKDYKQWTEGDLTLGISSAVKSIDYLKTKSDDMVSEVLDFAKSRKCDLYAIMAAHNDSGHFARQLLLISVQSGKPKTVAEGFAEKDREELRLKESDIKLDNAVTASGRKSDAPNWLKLWEQENLEASRKKVGPMLREAMRR